MMMVENLPVACKAKKSVGEKKRANGAKCVVG